MTRTLLCTLAFPNNNISCSCTRVGFMLISSIHLFRHLGVVPNALITTGTRFVSTCYRFCNSMVRLWFFTIFTIFRFGFKINYLAQYYKHTETHKDLQQQKIHLSAEKMKENQKNKVDKKENAKEKLHTV